MSRLARKTTVQFKLESTYGVNPGSWAAANALLVTNPDFRISRDVVPRELLRPFLGGSEQLPATRRAVIKFSVELAGAGAAGDVPAYGPLLRACGLAQTVTASTRVEYTPVSASFESGTFRYLLDGAMHVARGCRGTVKMMLNAYERPMLDFEFWGYDTLAYADDAVGANYDAWQRPLVVTDANSADIKTGGTFATGSISGGTALVSRGIEIDLGNKLSHLKLLGGEEIDITERETTGRMRVALTATDELTWRDDINAGTLTTLSFRHGTDDGHKLVLFAPAVQRIDPQSESLEGRLMFSTELRLLPEAGNDELVLVVK